MNVLEGLLKMAFCCRCGARNTESASFCVGCGEAITRLQPTNETSPHPKPPPVRGPYGYVTEVKNTTNGKKYLISTAEDKQAGGWQTAVFEMPPSGPPDVFNPAMFTGAPDEEHARRVHTRVEEIVAKLPSADWDCAKWALVKETLDAGFPESNAGPPPHAAPKETRGGASVPPTSYPHEGEAAEAILGALVKEEYVPLKSPEFEDHLRAYREDDSRDLIRLGYRLRLAEIQVFGTRRLVAVGGVEEMLRSDKASRKRTEVIANFLDDHDSVGLGEPVRPYVIAPFDELRDAFQQFVAGVMSTNSIPPDELDSQTEICARLIAYGYVYRVAEELVRQSAASI